LISLIKYELRHAPRLAELLNNRNISDRITTIHHPYTQKDAEEWISMCIESENDPYDRNFLIEKDGEIIGGIGITRTNAVSAMTGYWIGEPYQRKGYADAALKMIVEMGFKEMNLSRIFAYVYEGNEASAKLLLKNGFEYEGLLRKAELKNGNVINLELYARVI
jgi:RimJ/RimL family protein N-acetyltransferase